MNAVLYVYTLIDCMIYISIELQTCLFIFSKSLRAHYTKHLTFIANIKPDTLDEMSLADPFSSAAEESKLLDHNSFENIDCGINPLAFISLVDLSSFGTFSQIIFGGISMIAHKNMKKLDASFK